MPVVGCRAARLRRSHAAPRIIIDTDFSKWWDDVTALGIANVLHERGKVKLLGIVSDVPNPVAVAAIDAVDTAYGHAGPPGRRRRGGATPARSTTATPTRSPRSSRTRSPTAADSPDAVALYRRLLSRAPDHSVTIVSLGGYTNLAGLLAGPGRPEADHARR